MSYTARGIAIPRVSARGVTARHAVASRGWGIGSYSGRLGSLPASTSPDMSFTLAETDEVTARAAIAAVIAATDRRLPIEAVRTFQRTYGHGLTVDGVYGTNTRNALAAVTGRTDLPAVGSTRTSSAVATTTSVPDAMTTLAPEPETPSWLLPVAVGSALVLIVGGVVYMRRPVKANKKRRRGSKRRRVRRNTGFFRSGDHVNVRGVGAGTVVEVAEGTTKVRVGGSAKWYPRSSVSKS